MKTCPASGGIRTHDLLTMKCGPIGRQVFLPRPWVNMGFHLFSFIFSLTSSTLDHSATAPPNSAKLMSAHQAIKPTIGFKPGAKK